MRGRLGTSAEIIRGFHQPLSEVVQPNAIGSHASGERVFRACDCFCQLESAAAVLERFWLAGRGQNLDELPLSFRTLAARIAAKEYVGVARFVGILQDLRARRGARMRKL